MTQTNDDFTYDELNFDGLERRGNYRTIAYREDVLHALDRKDPAAIIYQIVYRWQTEFKKPDVIKKIEERKKAGLKPYTPQEIEDMMYVFMSYNDFVRETGGAIGYNTVIRMLDYLVNTKKVLKQRENHNPKYHDFEYSVNKNAMRELLKALPIEPAFAPKIPKKKSKSTQMGRADNGSGYSTHLGIPTEEIDSTQMGTQSTHLGIASTHLGREVYPNGGTSHNTTHTTHSNHTEGNTDALSDDERDTPTPSLQQFFTPTEECMCMYCQRVYKNSEIAATPGDLAPCGHDKNALFDVADNPQVNGDDDDNGNILSGGIPHHSGSQYGDTQHDSYLTASSGEGAHQHPYRDEDTATTESSAVTSEQNAEVWRQTLATSPSCDENPSTDEANSQPVRIERETANSTPSSPVVDAQKDVVIHEELGSVGTSYSPSNTAPSTTTEEVAPSEQTTGKSKGRGGRKKQQEELPPSIRKIEPAKASSSSRTKHVDVETLEPEVRRIVEDWQSLFKNPIPVTEKLVQAATLLVPVNPTREQLSEVRRYAYVVNPEWHVNQRRAVTLQSVVGYWEKWAAQADLADILASKPDDRLVANGHNPAPPRKRIKTNEELRNEDPWS